MPESAITLFPLVLVGPSGSGKTTVSHALARQRADVRFSVSATTRPARPGERDAIDYHFLDRARFEEMAGAGEFLEWEEVHGELYGTPRANLLDARQAGLHLVLDIDVQGARAVRARVPEAITVFLLPPSADVMLQRLRGRRSENERTLRTRLETAERELMAIGEFDYVVVNDKVEEAVETLDAILRAEQVRVARTPGHMETRVRNLVYELRHTLSADSRKS